MSDTDTLFSVWPGKQNCDLPSRPVWLSRQQGGADSIEERGWSGKGSFGREGENVGETE